MSEDSQRVARVFRGLVCRSLDWPDDEATEFAPVFDSGRLKGIVIRRGKDIRRVPTERLLELAKLAGQEVFLHGS